MAGRSNSFSDPLFQFAFFSNFGASIKYLAENLADQEKWDFGNPTTPKHSILRNYIVNTYSRLEGEKKIKFTSNNEFACFNTGLITSNLESIYALFERYKSVSGRVSPAPYFFKAFCKKSDNQLMCIFPTGLPEPANYFDNPELLIFNPLLELTPQIDHIIGDNLSRFPRSMRTMDTSELRRHLIGAIDETTIRVRTNYKLAIPQFYKNEIQLLLPLFLVPGSPNADLALTITKLPGAYTARTCLTLDMAYNNARLIVKPQSDWLHVNI